ncbi:hypothetical protein CU633_10175 [Bacillus sp. V3-13]|uniref:DUF3889 domain-containing protein n=1 Tax=Bacillus sp. V3-13 TaxID=2053728 RepID=UPI000C793D67|nr:DUF3889 domain-containing protein [Bacillus sp. V3-13]PLR77553.1 hypothetical protein CU633_10175 [Bacillus sp. V3-13]
MKKSLLIAMFTCLLYAAVPFHTAAQQQPDYEKYGRIATAVVKEDYPGAELKDYQYLGRKRISASDVSDSFRFQVTEQGKPKNVVVNVSHNLQNKKLLNLSVQEER